MHVATQYAPASPAAAHLQSIAYTLYVCGAITFMIDRQRLALGCGAETGLIDIQNVVTRTANQCPSELDL